MKKKGKGLGKGWKLLGTYKCPNGVVAKDYVAKNGDVVRVFPDGEYYYRGNLKI
jgi:hypothetical protein